MLFGNIFCAYCGGRLTTIRYRDRYTRADGTGYSVDQIKYSCYHKSRKLCECGGQTTYHVDRIDEAIQQIIRKIFSCMSGAPEEEQLQAIFKRQMAGKSGDAEKLDLELTKNQEQLTKLQLEITKTLTGDQHLFTRRFIAGDSSNEEAYYRSTRKTFRTKGRSAEKTGD